MKSVIGLREYAEKLCHGFRYLGEKQSAMTDTYGFRQKPDEMIVLMYVDAEMKSEIEGGLSQSLESLLDARAGWREELRRCSKIELLKARDVVSIVCLRELATMDRLIVEVLVAQRIVGTVRNFRFPSRVMRANQDSP